MAPSKEDRICSTNITLAIIEKSLQEAFDTDAEIIRWKAETSAAISGYMSTIIRLQLEWSKDFARVTEARRLVAKVPTASSLRNLLSDESAKAVEQVVDMKSSAAVLGHTTEVAFYEMMAGVAEPPLPLAKSFVRRPYVKSVNDVAFLLFEDLTLKGYVPHFCDGFTFKQVTQAANMLASLHAWSLKNGEKWLNRAEFETNTLDTLDMQCCQGQLIEGWTRNALEKMPKLPALFTAEQIEKVRKRYEPNAEFHYKRAFRLHKELNMTPVFCHNDPWTNNSFIKHPTTAGEEPDFHCLIDWQFCFPGSIAYSLGMIMLFSMNADIRRKHGAAIKRDYWNTFVAKMKPDLPPFSEDEYKRACEINEKCWAAFSIALLFQMMADQVDQNDADLAKRQEGQILGRIKGLIEDYY